jgi:hypothetical protein
MQNDGLALQLERHQTSSQFAPHRLCEVLRDQIDSGREKLIQKLLHETDNSLFERDKSELKNQKVRSQLSARHSETLAEGKRLANTKASLSSRILERRQTYATNLQHFEERYQSGHLRIANSKQLLTKSVENLRALASELSELRGQVALSSVHSTRAFRSSLQAFHATSTRHVSERKERLQQKASQKISSKHAAMAQTKSRCADLRTSLHTMAKFASKLASTASVAARYAEGNPAVFRTVLDSVISFEERASVAKQLGSHDDGGSLQTMQTDYQKALQAKEAELDAIIAQARKRRLQLQIELDAALEQIRRLQGSHGAEVDVTSDLDHSHYDFDASTRQLDATMSQLGPRPRRRR